MAGREKYYIFNEKGVFKKYKSEQPVSVGKRVYFVSKKGMAAPGWHVYENIMRRSPVYVQSLRQ